MRPSPDRRRSDFTVLVLSRLTQLRNAFDQLLREAPWRTFVVLALLSLIWAALYFLIAAVFRQVRAWDLVAIVANQQILMHFFLLLAVMLIFSDAILAFGSLYGQSEPTHLLAMPVNPRHAVCVKWIECMLMSSWSFMLMGVPLMLAIVRNTPVDWTYYPLFVAHFLGFMLIPGTVGLLIAWGVAMFAPHRPMRLAVVIGTLLFATLVAYMWRVSHGDLSSEDWLKTLFAQIGMVRTRLLPSTWTAQGVIAAIDRDVAGSIYWLGIVAANSAFLAWMTINLLGATWPEAYSRAQGGRGSGAIRSGWITQAACTVLFFYVPTRMRSVMLKDMRTFARDAMQWSQMVIMLGLLIVYALNLKRLPLDLEDARIKGLIAFLNLTTVSLILATFTSRFVYPLLSLESQQRWLLGLLPLRPVTLLSAKFLFAFTVTGLCSIGVMGLATSMLGLPANWVRLHLLVSALICAGLCSLSVGLGARFPVLGERNPARIASSFGGTLNLICSMLFVAVVVAGVGALSLNEIQNSLELPREFSVRTYRTVLALVAFSLIISASSLTLGSRHFARPA
ncbi:hypothetical protein RAS1_06430 [Phycisphaerae bacterium RAS1]|nr:hypothetical protein RAS1_06430 [Phycisphaerae bacterium RAS1]